jgi:hypothetical protein
MDPIWSRLALLAALIWTGREARSATDHWSDEINGWYEASYDARPLADVIIGDVAPADSTYVSERDEAFYDADFEMAQMLAPSVRGLTPRPTPVAQRRADPIARSAVVAGLASVPYMIGDTGAGTCTSFEGIFISADLAHPTLACSRLNVAENNTPLPINRWYASYRHYHNATPVRLFDSARTVNLDSFVLGGEHTFLNDSTSAEVRLPIEGRLSSELETVDPVPYDAELPTNFLSSRRTELGNVSTIFKVLIDARENSAVAGGLGVTWPTAQDVHLRALVQRTHSEEFDPPFPPTATLIENTLIDMQAANETIYLSPFLAWIVSPRPRWFHQGFCQVEVAANPSTIKLSGDGDALLLTPNDPPCPGFLIIFARDGRVDLHPQTLLRLNLGTGYVITDDPAADWIQTLTGLFEVHYTSTLEDAKFAGVTSHLITAGGTVPIDEVRIGNPANRVDIVNLALGLQANAGRFVITNGFVAPIREDQSDRGFDFEYNLQVQRPF